MPKCAYLGCGSETDGCKIQDLDVCLYHVNWAIGQAVIPIERFKEILDVGAGSDSGG